MHRNSLLKLIDTYGAHFPEESECVARFRQFVEDHEDCFERSLEIGHVTGSAWLVDGAGERVLLTHHAKLDIWVQLGGHADGVSDVLDVAMTEAREESGLAEIQPVTAEIFDLDIHTIPARKQDPEHEHFDVRFALRHNGEGDYIVSGESKDLAWVEIGKMGELTREESMLRMAEKWMLGRRDEGVSVG